MRVLILSGNTGEGHNSCAKAIKEVYDANGEPCTIADGLRFVSPWVSRMISSGHVFIYRRMPLLFGWGYKLTERHPGMMGQNSGFYWVLSHGADELKQYIEQNQYDAVICTHPFAALILTEMQKRYNLPVKTAFVATDYTCSPTVKDTQLNLYFIPDRMLQEEFRCKNITAGQMVASGIPIRQAFYTQVSKQQAKRRFDIQEDHKHIVMTCGSMGCGPIKRLAGTLSRQLQQDCELTVVCGTNDRLRRKLERKFADQGNLHVHGYVNDMSQMLDSADLYVTKPGGISTTEACAKGLPMLFVDAVAGCEGYNMDWFVRMGTAVTQKRTRALANECTQLIGDQTRQDSLMHGFAQMDRGNAAKLIYHAMKAG